jgi:tryptophan-rich sensory protein
LSLAETVGGRIGEQAVPSIVSFYHKPHLRSYAMILRTALFLLLNFGALAIGGLATGAGVPSDWYQNLNKAPWTPPGWVFGVAWTTIMLCFSFYMAQLWPKAESRNMLIGLYALQWLLNVSWNPLFFHFHFTKLALVFIVALTALVIYLLVHHWQTLGWWSVLLLPYAVWMLIATSLNAYVVAYN